MCGISGILEFDSQKRFDAFSLKLMNRAIIHRGPDEQGFFDGGNIGLGNRRLSIIDITGGRQPIHNEDKSLWIVFNGEIYNFLELREKLQQKKHKFYTKTDTETILHLYEEEGEDFVKRLDGMFALAIWNSKKKELFLARDPLGKKPLFWSVFDNKLIFSSEIKGILGHKDFKKGIDRETLGKYFLYGFIPAPFSIFEKVKKVLPGHYMIVSQGGKIRSKKYWDLDYFSSDQLADEESVKGEIVKLLEKAVQKRLISDVPLGVFLSGGVDSGLVTAMMGHFISPDKIKAFSIGFKEKEYDESLSAKTVARSLGVKHYLKMFSQKDLSPLIPKVLNLLDEPMADPSLLPTFLLSEFAREEVKVALSGDGGDENFAGYPKYLANWYLEDFGLKMIPLSLFASFFSGKFSQFLKYANKPLYLRNQLWINPFNQEEVEDLIGKRPDFSDLEKYHSAFKGQKRVDEAFFLDQKLTLPDLYLVKTDRASMMASLEVRCPFLDKNLVEFAAKIPYQLKLKGFRTKSLLRSIAEDYLPKEIIKQPKKGFGVPLSLWFKAKEGRKILDILSREKIKKDAILNCNMVEDIVESGNSQQIWALLVFQWWRKKWLAN